MSGANKGQIIEQCLNYKETAEKVGWHSRGDIKMSAAGQTLISSIKGTYLKKHIAIQSKPTATTEVKEIRCITKSDIGSANDGNGKNTQEGFIYGGKYTFKVTQYTKGKPLNPNNINWIIKYQSPKYSLNKWIERKLPVTGEQITLIMNDTDMCGGDVYVRAYITNKEQGAELKIWKHNRFRWFDKKIFETGLKERMADPTKINQQHTSLCGTAALLYFYAKAHPDTFLQKYMEFFRTGQETINSFKLAPNDKIFEMEPFESNDKYPCYKKYSNGKPIIPHDLMNTADWITLVGTRSSDNPKYTGEDGQDWQAINWPDYMIDMTTKLYGAKVAEDNTFIITGKDFSNKLIEIQKLYQEGWHIMLLIDSDMLNDSVSYLGCISNYHWISYEGDLLFDQKHDTYQFSYYCWAKLTQKRSFKSNVFNTNFYGFIQFK